MVVSDLYGFHVLNALGALQAGLSGAQLEEIDTCLTGHYFRYANVAKNQLTHADEVAVNNFLALKGGAAGTAAGPGAASTADLTAWFDKGVLTLHGFASAPTSTRRR